MKPPDLEDMIRRGQEKFRQSLPGGFGGSRGIWLVVIIAVALWLASGFYRVMPDEQGVVLRFGKFVGTTTSGLNYHLPWPIETVETPRVTVENRIEVGFGAATGGDRSGRLGPTRAALGEPLMLTGDENIVNISFSVFWRIKDAGEYLFNIRDQQSNVQAVAESVVREIVGRTPIVSMLAEGRGKIEAAALEGTQAILDMYKSGIQITALQLVKVDPPNEVVDAFRDVQRARADQERVRNEAEAYANDIIPRARGDAARLQQEAEGYRLEVVARATGDAERFRQVYDAYAGAKDITAQRLYIDTMTAVLKNANKVLIDPSANGSGVVPYLPLPEVQRRSQAAPPRPGAAVPSTRPAPAAAANPGAAR
jgi:membrane protease subunit HflK